MAKLGYLLTDNYEQDLSKESFLTLFVVARCALRRLPLESVRSPNELGVVGLVLVA
jgi:hypothetical protein